MVQEVVRFHTDDKINQILQDTIKKAITLILKEYRLVDKIILFGSCARGELTARSDIDLCVVHFGERDREAAGYLTDILEFEYKVKVQPTFIAKEVFDTGSNRLLTNIRKDGIVLWEHRD